MKNITFNVIYNYLRNKRLRKDGSALVLIRATLGRKSKYFKTGISLAPKQWSGKNFKWVSQKHPMNLQFNKAILEQMNKMQTYEYEVLRATGTVDLEQLKEYDQEKLHRTHSFTNFYKKQLDEVRQYVEYGTYTNQRQTFEKLQGYRKQIYFNQIDLRLIRGFHNYLLSLNLHINTVEKHHRYLKKFIKLAKGFGYLDKDLDPYFGFRIKREETEVLFLTREEISAIENRAFPEEIEHLERYRDFFLFMYYTGLRFSDAKRVTVDNILIEDGQMSLRLVAKKTKKPHILPLYQLFGGKPQRLIEKYLERYDHLYYDDPDEKRPPLFFTMHNQVFNRNIKEIAKPLEVRDEVKRKITAHVARHSFATHLIVKGVKMNIVQKLLQHSKAYDTQRYLHILGTHVKEDLEGIDWD